MVEPKVGRDWNLSHWKTTSSAFETQQIQPISVDQQFQPIPKRVAFAEVVPGSLHRILEVAGGEVGVAAEALVQANGVGEEDDAGAAFE